MRLEISSCQYHTWVFISILSLLMVIYVWMGRNGGFSGDYRIHKMFISQLLNGFGGGHMYYEGAPVMYPPLAHTSIAALSRLIGLSVHRSYFLLTSLVAFIIPYACYCLAKDLRLSHIATFFLAMSISLYGGFLQFRFAPVAVMFAKPLLPETLNILLFICFLSLWVKIYQEGVRSYAYSLSLGIVVGLMGLTHPYTFQAAFMWMGAGLIIDIYKRKVSIESFLPILLGGAISCLFYFPLIVDIIRYEGLIRVATKKAYGVDIRRILQILMNPLILLGVCALFTREKKDLWVRLSFLSIAVLIVAIVILGNFPDFQNAWQAFRVERYGRMISIFAVFTGTFGIERFYSLSRGKHWKLKRFFVVAIIIILFCGGQYTAYMHFRSNQVWYAQIPEKGIRRFFPKGGFKDFIKRYFPEGVVEFENSRNIFMAPVTIMAPVEFSKYFAWASGYDVTCVDRSRNHFNKFLDYTVPQDQRFNDVNVFYQELDKGNIRWDILFIYRVKGFLAPQDDLDKKYSVIRKIYSGDYSRKQWHIYKLLDKSENGNAN